MDKNLLPFVIGGVALALLAVVVYQNYVPSETGIGQIISKDEIGTQVIDFIKNNLAASETEFTLGETEEKNGLYEIKFEVMGQEETAYATKNGKYLFFQPVDMLPSEPQTFTKTEKPKVDLFVMAFCPYGNQSEEMLIPVAESLGDKADIELHYIIYNNYATGYPDYCLDTEKTFCSMHGIQEVNQGIRELCVQKYQKDKLWDFVKIINEQSTSEDVDTKWENIAQSLGVDVEKIKTCQQEEGSALLTQELSLTNAEYSVQDASQHNGQETEKVSGSPTLVINGMISDGTRSIAGYQESICSAFETLPTECEQVLEENSSAASGSCE